MSQHSRTQALDALTKQLESTQDPALVLKITNQIAKLQRERKPGSGGKRPGAFGAAKSIREKYLDAEGKPFNALGHASDEVIVLEHKIELAEEKIKQLGRKPSEAEIDAIFQQVEREVADQNYVELVQRS